MTASRDGVELSFSTAGDGGLTVVLVHGWAGNRGLWARQVDALVAAGFAVVAMDLAGHGASGRGRADWTLPAFGEDVVAVVESVGAPRVALVGHSMGGDAVTYAAATLGDRVAGVVWVDAFRSLTVSSEPVTADRVDAFLAPFRDDFAAAVDGFARNLFGPGADRALVDRIAAEMAATPKDPALDALRHVFGREAPIVASLGEIDAPVVAINPDNGETDVDSLRAHGVDPTLLPDVGHFPMLEDPDAFDAALVERLRSFG